MDLSDPVITSLFNPMVATEAGAHPLEVSESTGNQTGTSELFTAAVHHYDLAKKVLEELPSPEWHSFHDGDDLDDERRYDCLKDP